MHRVATYMYDVYSGPYVYECCMQNSKKNNKKTRWSPTRSCLQLNRVQPPQYVDRSECGYVDYCFWFLTWRIHWRCYAIIVVIVFIFFLFCIHMYLCMLCGMPLLLSSFHIKSYVAIVVFLFWLLLVFYSYNELVMVAFCYIMPMPLLVQLYWLIHINLMYICVFAYCWLYICIWVIISMIAN